VVLLPRDVEDATVLTPRYHVRPVFTVDAGAKPKSSSTALPVAFPVAAVAPTTSSMFAAANSQLESYPTRATPAFGSLAGTGLYEVQLAYSFDPSKRTSLFTTFGGLVQSAAAATPRTPGWRGASTGSATSTAPSATCGHSPSAAARSA